MSQVISIETNMLTALGPAYSKTMKYVNTGAYSNASYTMAPGSYQVPNGDYHLTCAYRTSSSAVRTPCQRLSSLMMADTDGQMSDAITCMYTSGSGVGPDDEVQLQFTLTVSNPSNSPTDKMKSART